MKLRALVDRLGGLDLQHVQHEALATEASALVDTIRQALDQVPGGPHDYPWRETGALQASIAATVDGPMAVVGSTDEVARYQETGTATIPPRPFLSPLAEAHADRIAHAIGAAVVQTIRSL